MLFKFLKHLLNCPTYFSLRLHSLPKSPSPGPPLPLTFNYYLPVLFLNL